MKEHKEVMRTNSEYKMVIALLMLNLLYRKQVSKLNELERESANKRYRNLPPRDRLRLKKQQQADEEARRIA